jgi:hypothetical protein
MSMATEGGGEGRGISTDAMEGLQRNLITGMDAESMVMRLSHHSYSFRVVPNTRIKGARARAPNNAVVSGVSGGGGESNTTTSTSLWGRHKPVAKEPNT